MEGDRQSLSYLPMHTAKWLKESSIFTKVHGFHCSEVFCSKVSSRFLQQDLRSSYGFGKIQNLEGPELCEENI